MKDMYASRFSGTIYLFKFRLKRSSMIPLVRQQYNQQFTPEKYNAYVAGLAATFPGHLDFRIAETPVFIPHQFGQKMLEACEHIINVVGTEAYLQQSEDAIPPLLRVPNQDAHPHFIAFDFGICLNSAGELEPQLIEMQGFPTIFAWQVIQVDEHRRHFAWPDGFSMYLNGYNRESYIQLLRDIIIGDSQPENVVLLEIFPEKQKTRVDFFATKELLGIETVCLTELEQEEKALFYRRNGKRLRIERIYNRVIFDELFQQPGAVQEKGKLMMQNLDVTWVPHPNWFYRLSKFTLPFIRHPYVPETRFLHTIDTLPEDLENFVVKPLFSFAGQGVIIDVTREAIHGITDPQNWILQRKVQYAAVIETPDEPAKAEIRIFYMRPPGASKPVAVCNLSRLSKGKMIGVRYNQDKTWVGGSFSLFEEKSQ